MRNLYTFRQCSRIKTWRGTSLAVQWLRLHPSTAGGMGLIPGLGTKIPHATRPGKKKKERERETWRKNLSPARSRGPSWLTQPSPGSISQTTGYPRTYETEINAYCYKLLGFWDGWWYSQNWQVVHLGFYPSTYNYGYKCYCISLEVFIDYQPST